MKVESLKELETAFAEWRRKKKSPREPVPETLLSRAHRAAKKHGMAAVFRVTRVDRARIRQSDPRAPQSASSGPQSASSGETLTAASTGAVAFSRLELGMPSQPNNRPLAEVETAAGVKLRVFEVTPEMLSLLSAACGSGADR